MKVALLLHYYSGPTADTFVAQRLRLVEASPPVLEFLILGLGTGVSVDQIVKMLEFPPESKFCKQLQEAFRQVWQDLDDVNGDGQYQSQSRARVMQVITDPSLVDQMG